MKPDLADVLKVVNRAREVLEFEPLGQLPKGIKYSRVFCPLARALGLQVQPDSLILHALDSDKYDAMLRALAPETSWSPQWKRIHEEILEIKLPNILVDFLVYFESDEYPELIE